MGQVLRWHRADLCPRAIRCELGAGSVELPRPARGKLGGSSVRRQPRDTRQTEVPTAGHRAEDTQSPVTSSVLLVVRDLTLEGHQTPRLCGPGVQCPRGILWVQLPPPRRKDFLQRGPMGPAVPFPPRQAAALSPKDGMCPQRCEHTPGHRPVLTGVPTPGRAQGRSEAQESSADEGRRVAWRQQSWPCLPPHSPPLHLRDCVGSLQPLPTRSLCRCPDCLLFGFLTWHVRLLVTQAGQVPDGSPGK